MSQIHRRILNTALGALDEETAAYFTRVAERIDEDPRTGKAPNLVYLVLADTVRCLPTYLEQRELVNRLFRFIDNHHGRLNKVIFSPEYLENKDALRAITGDFVAEIVEAALVLYERGEIDSGEATVHRITFDESGVAVGDFPYEDMDDDEDGHRYP